MQYAFFFDQSRCIGCNACTVACKDWNQVNPGPVRWRKQQNYELKDGQSVFENLSMACNHCEKPACRDVCGAGAISKLDNGIVYVDRSKCISLQACISACPFATPKIAGDKQEPNKKSAWKVNHPMQKCNYCWERVMTKGEPPVCVASCPVRALDFGDSEVIRNRYTDAVRMNKTDFPYAYRAGAADNTVPSFFIRKRKELVVSDFTK